MHTQGPRSLQDEFMRAAVQHVHATPHLHLLRRVQIQPREPEEGHQARVFG